MKYSVPHKSTTAVMKAGPGRCVFNMPEGLKSIGSGDSEIEHALPPHHARIPYLVDKYPACPKHWSRSEGKLMSYVVPIIEGRGMWLDFNHTLANTEMHVAIVISVQGINPVTGLQCKDTQLEQYIETCPKHSEKFGPDRFCKACNFKWPKQNYVASTGTPEGQLWLDGFRAADGVIRQYILTAEKARGVANAVIGEQRVFAIGLSFFLSKTTRPKPQHVLRSSGPVYGHTWNSLMDGGLKKGIDPDVDVSISDSTTLSFMGPIGDMGSKGVAGDKGPAGDKGFTAYYSNDAIPKGGRLISAGGQSVRSLMSVTSPVSVQKAEVAAGAKIRQHIHDDPNGLDFWQPEPESILIVNYAFEADMDKILAGGTIDIEGSKEGFLQKIPVGN